MPQAPSMTFLCAASRISNGGTIAPPGSASILSWPAVNLSTRSAKNFKASCAVDDGGTADWTFSVRACCACAVTASANVAVTTATRAVPVSELTFIVYLLSSVGCLPPSTNGRRAIGASPANDPTANEVAWLHVSECYTANPKAKRVEVLFPDPMANPYLGFAAMLMAGLDGIKNKIDPGPAMDKDLYDLPKDELKQIPTVCGSLREALENLDKDRAFLKNGGVFDDDFIDSFIELKMTEVERFEMTPHPVEFDMYYSQ